MTRTRQAAVPCAVLSAGVALLVLAAACGPKRVAEPPTPTDLIVLLPGEDPNATGRVTVSSRAGQTVELDGERESTKVAANKPPTPPATLDKAEVDRIFGDTIKTLPPEPHHFQLYFRFESDELTDESRALVPEILRLVGERPFPDVTIVGHTDTTGTSKSNHDLGLKRATTIRNWLVARGLEARLVEVASHGEADLLVPTADNTAEPRNRRVEISVR
ncbi:MAG TPA: OmpA family protein [Vicinamibacterales bacterium]|jgi:outer membrane protein OmpA-like peptidoglycan-associated protein|nr:OmpA family protein [Vicinamibacterales bacterium]